MSNNCKTLMRPKVRFSQASDSTDDSEAAGPFHGPKIKSIITLDKPVKFVHGVSEQDLPKNRQETVNQSPLDNAKKASSPLQSIASAPCLTESKTQEKAQKPLKVSASEPRVPSKQPQRSALKASTKKAPERPKNLPTRQSNPTKAHGKSQDRTESNKENVGRSIPKEQASKAPPKSSDKRNEEKLKNNVPQRSNVVHPTSTKLSKPVKTPGIIDAAKKSLVSSQARASSAPPRDSKAKQTAGLKNPQNKASVTRSKSQAKISIVRNISGAKPNVYVGPGMSRNRTKSLSTATEPVNPRSDFNSGDKLNRPEYNSIVHTIKKLQEAQKEKVVTNFDHLPSTYKSLVMRKVSSALDFPAGEAIFHNLIDLSIDENQLPLRMTRSKDPEPRQKDLEPSLSDFFVPQYAEEYSEAVKVRPRTPEMIDNWSAFRISDRIFNWKTCLDEI